MKILNRILDCLFGQKCPHGSRSNDWVDHAQHEKCRYVMDDLASKQA